MTQVIPSRLSGLRAAVVVAALCSLFVSSNVGPHFLPLPALDNYRAADLQASDATASRSHCTAADSFRVPMAQAQKRANGDLQTQPLAAMAALQSVLPNNTRVFADVSYPDVLVTVALASLQSGRAPPRFV